ncbi:MAG: response regulator [Candidatus Uhrbacteria bacterium]
MHILVVDDSPANTSSAYWTLPGHNLTVCGTVEEACQALGFRPGAPAVSPSHLFDAVLTDLWMPMPLVEHSKLLGVYFGRKQIEGSLSPVGLVFALRALNLGVRFIAILTDSDHHSDSLVTLMDLIDGQLSGNTPVVVGKYEKRWFECGRNGPKDWGKLLARIMEEGK